MKKINKKSIARIAKAQSFIATEKAVTESSVGGAQHVIGHTAGSSNARARRDNLHGFACGFSRATQRVPLCATAITVVPPYIVFLIIGLRIRRHPATIFHRSATSFATEPSCIKPLGFMPSWTPRLIALSSQHTTFGKVHANCQPFSRTLPPLASLPAVLR